MEASREEDGDEAVKEAGESDAEVMTGDDDVC